VLWKKEDKERVARNNEVRHKHKEAMTVWEEAHKATRAMKKRFTLEKPTLGVIEKGTKRPTGPKHAEVASDGEQNDEEDDDDD
jgi:hypothetical protein